MLKKARPLIHDCGSQTLVNHLHLVTPDVAWPAWWQDTWRSKLECCQLAADGVAGWQLAMPAHLNLKKKKERNWKI